MPQALCPGVCGRKGRARIGGGPLTRVLPGPRPGLLSSPPLLRWPESSRPGQMAHPREAGGSQWELPLRSGGRGLQRPSHPRPRLQGRGPRLARHRLLGVDAGPGSLRSRQQATGHTASTQLWQRGEPAPWGWGRGLDRGHGDRGQCGGTRPPAPARDAAPCAYLPV